MKCKAGIELFVQKDPTFKLIKESFPKIEEVVKILSQIHTVTKLLQKTDFTLSDFYGSFIRMRETIKKLEGLQNKQTDLAKFLLEELNGRQDELLKNESILCAVYLDLRFAALLTADETEFAKKSMFKLYQRAISIMELDKQEQISQDNDKGNESIDEFDMETFLIGKGCEPLVCDEIAVSNEELVATVQFFNTKMSEIDFLVLLDRFETQFSRIHYKISILNFWEENKTIYPELYILSTILNSIPPAQASVERCFSVLSFMYNCSRCKLSLEILQELLLININKDLVDGVFDADMSKLNK